MLADVIIFVYEVPCIFRHYINVDEVSLITLKKVLQSAMDLLQIATGITRCDDYYKLRQYSRKQSHKKGDGIGVGRTSQKVSIFF